MRVCSQLLIFAEHPLRPRPIVTPLVMKKGKRMLKTLNQLKPLSRLTRLLVLGLSAAANGQTAPPDEEGDNSLVAPGEYVRVDLSLTYTSDYYYRGILQEDEGFILQSSAEVGISLVREESWKLEAFGGIWNSHHDRSTGSTDDDRFVSKWYEADVYGGLGLEVGPWSGSLAYVAYTSPNGAFDTTDELLLCLSLDDTDSPLGFALQPSLQLAWELGGGADGDETGVFLAIGIAPGFEAENLGGLQLSFPATLGFSLDDYYQDGEGDDDAFGYLDFGVDASLPLGVPSGYGEWALNAGVHGLLLGDNNAEVNDDDDFEVIFSVGLSFSF